MTIWTELLQNGQLALLSPKGASHFVKAEFGHKMKTDCLFCKIIEKKIPAKTEYEDEDVLVFQDINPKAPVHLLFVPKKHIEKMSDLTAGEIPLAGRLIYKAGEMARSRNWTDYRLVFNNGAQAGQSVFHIHLHLLSGRRMHWPPG